MPRRQDRPYTYRIGSIFTGYFSKAIDEVRVGEARELKANGEAPVLQKSRWLLLKRPENLTEKQAPKLKELLKLNLRCVRAYLPKEEFQRFWTYVSPYWAGRFVDQRCEQTIRSQIEPMKKIARMLRRHRPLILNRFRAKGQLSSGVVEGFNTKAKLTTRKSFGFRAYHGAEIALYHTLGDLPEPDFTHRFCGGAKKKWAGTRHRPERRLCYLIKEIRTPAGTATECDSDPRRWRYYRHPRSHRCQ